MARAFLTDRKLRNSWELCAAIGPAGCIGLPSVALDEARAILAETEPAPLELYRHVPIGGDVYMFETEIMAGLAESLRAFVEA